MAEYLVYWALSGLHWFHASSFAMWQASGQGSLTELHGARGRARRKARKTKKGKRARWGVQLVYLGVVMPFYFSLVLLGVHVFFWIPKDPWMPMLPFWIPKDSWLPGSSLGSWNSVRLPCLEAESMSLELAFRL